MNTSINVTSHSAIGGTITINPSHISAGMMSDGMSEPSSPESSSFDPSDLLSSSVADEVTAQLASSGPIGMAAAAAIATSKKRKRPHQFETNPSNRKRQQTRLLRKLKTSIEEYTTRVGQQAVVLCCTPGKSSQSLQSFKVFGSQPLENVIRNCRSMIIQDLESALAEQAPPQAETSSMHELPPLSIDGIPTPVDKMTQAQLRAFIPLMLKYSTGRGKPGWGKLEYRPVWWPSDLPWANVRSDARTEDEKQKVSWTEALRTIVKNCYKNHGRDDLLHIFQDENQSSQQPQPAPTHYNGTMIQTVSNPDGTVSIIQIDTATAGSVVTLPDGTQATVVHAQMQDHHQQEATQAVQTLANVAANHQEVGAPVTTHVNPVGLELNTEVGHHQTATTTLAGATINSEGQLVFTGDGNIGSSEGTGVVTIPVSLYQIVGTNVNLASQQIDSSQSQPSIQVAMAPVSDGSKEDITGAPQAVEVMSVHQSRPT